LGPPSETDKIIYYIAGQNWEELVKIGQPAVEPLIRVLRDRNNAVRAFEQLRLKRWEKLVMCEQSVNLEPLLIISSSGGIKRIPKSKHERFYNPFRAR